jgi:hypothetical protein
MNSDSDDVMLEEEDYDDEAVIDFLGGEEVQPFKIVKDQ